MILQGNTIINTGCYGISISGGNQKDLVYSNNLISNNTIQAGSRWTRTYNPAISFSDVGSIFEGNYIENHPHAGMLGLCTDCLFQYNYFENLCYEVSDSGAFYSGRSWSHRSNVIRFNTFRDIRVQVPTYLGVSAVQAVYLDDQLSGEIVYNNTFYNCENGILLGGGK